MANDTQPTKTVIEAEGGVQFRLGGKVYSLIFDMEAESILQDITGKSVSETNLDVMHVAIDSDGQIKLDKTGMAVTVAWNSALIKNVLYAGLLRHHNMSMSEIGKLRIASGDRNMIIMAAIQAFENKDLTADELDTLTAGSIKMFQEMKKQLDADYRDRNRKKKQTTEKNTSVPLH